VNLTKTVLDAKDNPATATEMKTAFCQRMDAYHQIAACFFLRVSVGKTPTST
jgi:hypothetical protein